MSQKGELGVGTRWIVHLGRTTGIRKLDVTGHVQTPVGSIRQNLVGNQAKTNRTRLQSGAYFPAVLVVLEKSTKKCDDFACPPLYPPEYEAWKSMTHLGDTVSSREKDDMFVPSQER